jgi:transposase
VSVSAPLQERVRELEQALEQRERALVERDEKIAELVRDIEALEQDLRGAARDRAKLEARLKELLAKRRALADLAAPGQLTLFTEPEPLATPPCANEAPDGETGADRIRPRHERKHAPREISYASLPREHVQHELPEAERICPITGMPLVVTGEKTSEELEYRQAKLVVIVHHRAVYGLAENDRAERKSEPLLAPMPHRPIENALAGVALLAWILVQKYCNHLPLYRQQSIFARDGLELPRQTLCDWVMASAYNLGPIQEALKRELLASGVLQLDDTPVECLRRQHGGYAGCSIPSYSRRSRTVRLTSTDRIPTEVSGSRTPSPSMSVDSTISEMSKGWSQRQEAAKLIWPVEPRGMFTTPLLGTPTYCPSRAMAPLGSMSVPKASTR